MRLETYKSTMKSTDGQNIIESFSNWKSSNSSCTRNIDEVIKKLKQTDFISIFFILIDFNKFSCDKYLDIIENDRKCLEEQLKNIVKNDNGLLIEILGTIKRYDLLKLVGSCSHQYTSLNKINSLCKLKKLWKTLYHVSEMIDQQQNSQVLKAIFPEKIVDVKYPEKVFAQAYKEKKFTYEDLSTISKVFENVRPDIFKLLDQYDDDSSTHYHIGTPTSSKPCGLAIIINHENFSENNDEKLLTARKHSKYDIEILQDLWKSFGFEVQTYQDLTDEEVLEKFKNIANSDLSRYDIFVACYMSHGDNGVVYASNSKKVQIETLENIMANQCKTLFNKPKLFFIQACQGKNVQRGVSYPSIPLNLSSTQNTDNHLNIPLYSDILKVVSSIPGYVSFAETDRPSWFIGALVDNLKKFGHKRSIVDIMGYVNKEVSQKNGKIHIQDGDNCKQTVLTTSTLREVLILKKIVTE